MGIQERKKREKARRRQQILAATKKIVGTNGFSRATLDDIAREAELSPATIYHYFDSKEELFISLTFQSLQYLDLRLGEVFALHATSDVASKISALRDILAAAYEFDPLIFENMFRLITAETLGAMTPTSRVEVKRLFSSIIENLNAIFADGSKVDASSRKAEKIANLFFTLLSGVSIWSGISGLLLKNENVAECSENFDVMVDLLGHTIAFLEIEVSRELQPIEQ